MLRSFQAAVVGLLTLILLAICLVPPSIISTTGLTDPYSATQQILRFPPFEDQNFADARARTHRIWTDLRDAEPTWKESIIDSRPGGLPTTIWHYIKTIFRTLFMNAPPRHAGSDSPTLRPGLQEAIDGLTQSATVDPDALFLLAEMNFYGNFSHPRRMRGAFDLYSELAARDGNATAQHMLGLLYATGIEDAVEVDQAKAQLYYTFAAEQGEVKAEMTLAHRYHMGIGTVKSCEKAVEYYKRVADKSMDWWLSGPPGGHLIQRNAWRWVDEAGGPYGEGASWSSSGPFAADKNAVYTSFDNVLEFLDMRERQGDFGASLTLGKHFYEPPRGYRRNLKKARQQFSKVAFQYWGKDGKVKEKVPKGIEKTAAKAAAYIGRMFLRGEGMEQNFERAITWFKRGIDSGDTFAQYHMGLMYRDGLGVPKDGRRAAAYLKAASEQSLGIAQSALGVLFLDQGDLNTASRYFELGKNAGVMEAFYYLAEMSHQGQGRQQNCQHATTYYKIVAEKAEALHSAFTEANSAYERNDFERAFIASLMAAEQGFENAQANVAFLLDQRTSVVSLPMLPISIFSKPLSGVPATQRSELLTNPRLAQVYYTRSAHQQNVDSLIKAGDYHSLGIGTPTKTVLVNSNKSSSSIEAMYSCYSTAAEHPNAAQALWNMGWMHENGIGSVEQDFHMAKRYYDLAYEMNKEAYLPVKVALLRLRARSWWNGVSGGKVKPMEDDAEDERNKRPKSFMEWLNRFLDAAEEMDAQEYAALQQQEGDDGLDHVAFGEPGMPGGDAEYWYTTGAAREGAEGEGEDVYGDLDDGLLESLVIVALAGTLAMLVYLRQQRQREQRERERREAGQQGQGGGNGGEQVQQQRGQRGGGEDGGQVQGQEPEQNGGFFPNPGDPEYQNWVAGGVGH